MPTDRVPFKADSEPELARNAISVNRIEGLSYLDYSSYHRMCNFLRISDADRREPKIAEKVGYITDWAQMLSGSKREIDHMKEIKRLIGEMGESKVGVDLLDKLHRYTRLNEDKRQIDEEIELLAKEKPEVKTSDNTEQFEEIKEEIKSLRKTDAIRREVSSLKETVVQLNQRLEKKPRHRTKAREEKAQLKEEVKTEQQKQYQPIPEPQKQPTSFERWESDMKYGSF